MAKSVSGGSEDAEDRSPRSLRRSGGRAGGAGGGSRWSHRDQRGTRSRVVRRVQSARRGLLLPEVRLRGAGLLLPGVLSVRVPVLLRSRRVRAEPAGGRIPVAAAVSGAGPAPAAAPERRQELVLDRREADLLLAHVYPAVELVDPQLADLERRLVRLV